MLGWLKKPAQRSQPEARWVVAVEPDAIRVSDPEGLEKVVPKSELSGVVIETNDTGPWGADVWWLLFGTGDRPACAYPQGATGEQAALDYLLSLNGFDQGAMTSAMRSVENAVFPVWRSQG